MKAQAGDGSCNRPFPREFWTPPIIAARSWSINGCPFRNREPLFEAAQIISECPEIVVANFSFELGHARVGFLRLRIADVTDKPVACVLGVGADLGQVGTFHHPLETARSSRTTREAAKLFVLRRPFVGAGEGLHAAAKLRRMASLAVCVEGLTRGGKLDRRFGRRDYIRRLRRRRHGRRDRRRGRRRRRRFVAAGGRQECDETKKSEQRNQAAEHQSSFRGSRGGRGGGPPNAPGKRGRTSPTNGRPMSACHCFICSGVKSAKICSISRR